MSKPVVVYDGAVSRADLDVWNSELVSLFSRMRPHAQTFSRCSELWCWMGVMVRLGVLGVSVSVGGLDVV
jgi:hypothetical protein